MPLASSNDAPSSIPQTDCTVLILDRRGLIAACHEGDMLFGKHRSRDMLGKHCSSILAAPSGAAWLDSVLKGEVSERVSRAKTWVLDKQGRPGRVEMSIQALSGDDNDAMGFALILRDLKLNRRTHERLRECERRLRLFLQGVPDHAICMLDPDGRVLDWNAGLRRTTGFVAGNMVGRSFAPLIASFRPAEEELPARLLQLASEGVEAKVECQMLRADGTEFPAEAEMQAVHDSDGSLIGFALLIRDCTQQRALERHLQEARDRLVHAEKIEAVARLTGGIAHDFNNALQGIISSLELALTSLSQRRVAQAGQHMSIALDTAMHAGRLTQRLLSLLRRPASFNHRTNVVKVLRSMRELLGRTLGDGIRFDVSCPEELPLLVCDRDQLESALVNLSVNSRDAMAGRGCLNITCRLCSHDDNAVRIPLDPSQGSYVEIAVVDDGPGMSEDVMQHAFEPFFTTKPEGLGTGLGLSMVRAFAEQYNGEVDIFSAPGAGTTVLLYLPCSEATMEVAMSKSTMTVPNLQGFRILVAEDNEIIRQSVATRLRQLGCEVAEAESGSEALSVLASHASWDLLLSDIDLPMVNGYELCNQARKKLPGLPVILMTGYADAEWLESSELDSATEALIKPFDMKELLAKAQSLLQPAV